MKYVHFFLDTELVEVSIPNETKKSRRKNLFLKKFFCFGTKIIVFVSKVDWGMQRVNRYFPSLEGERFLLVPPLPFIFYEKDS